MRAAMATQAQMEGRYLGGRPPYGYLLIDAGPHPNPAKAADGKRLHILAIDEPAAAVVRRIFAEFLAGFGIYAIAERLTAESIPCPSAHDPERNRHRCGVADLPAGRRPGCSSRGPHRACSALAIRKCPRGGMNRSPISLRRAQIPG